MSKFLLRDDDKVTPEIRKQVEEFLSKKGFQNLQEMDDESLSELYFQNMDEIIQVADKDAATMRPQDAQKLAKDSKDIVQMKYKGKNIRVLPNESSSTSSIEKQVLQQSIEPKEVDLTEEEIMNIVKEETSVLTKNDIIEEVNNRINENRPNRDIISKIESGEIDLAKLSNNPELMKSLSDSIFGDVLSNIKQKSGSENMDISVATRTMFGGLTNAIRKESEHKEELERLAVELVKREYGIPEGLVDFDAKITPEGAPSNIGGKTTKMSKGTKRPPVGKSEEELKPELLKKKLLNGMIHGSARKGQYLYHMANERLSQIDPELVNDYNKVLAGNDYMYWAMDDNFIKQQSQSGTKAGVVRVDLSGEKPKIIARGMTFPFLLHELTKGVMDLMSMHGLSSDKETREYLSDQADHMEDEPWDLRIGPKVWEKFLMSLNIDDYDLKSSIYHEVIKLPATEFNELMLGLLKDDGSSKNKLKEIVRDVKEKITSEKAEDELEKYRDDDDDLDDINLNKMGLDI